jgi:hypothetical protein
VLAKSSPALSDPLDKACALAEQIRELRNVRNALIHELATAMGHRERQLFGRPPEMVEAELTFEDLQTSIKLIEARTDKELSEITMGLSGWYELLAKLSNEAFIVEHKSRKLKSSIDM